MAKADLTLAEQTMTRGRRDDAPTGRAPERAEGLGSALYRIAEPALGAEDAARLKQAVDLFDEVPAIAAAFRQAAAEISPRSTRETSITPAGSIGSTSIATTPRSTVFLATVLAAVVIVLGVGVVLWVRDLNAMVLSVRETHEGRFGALEQALASEAGKREAVVKQQADEVERNDKQDERIARAEETLTILTEHVLGRLDALGEQTGADKLPAWTSTPAELRLVVVEAEAMQEQRERQGGTPARTR